MLERGQSTLNPLIIIPRLTLDAWVCIVMQHFDFNENYELEKLWETSFILNVLSGSTMRLAKRASPIQIRWECIRGYTQTAQRSIDRFRDRLQAPLEYD